MLGLASPMYTKLPNNIVTGNLIAILSMRSIYDEVYKLMGSN